MATHAKHYRDYSTFDNEAFRKDIKEVDFNYNISLDVHDSMNSVIDKISKITDKHAPLHVISSKRKRQFKKS